MHGGSLSVQKICFILIALISISSYSAVLKSKKVNQTFDPNNVLQSHKSKYSLNDKKLANNIARVYEVAQKGYPNRQILQRLVKKIKKNTSFKIFLPWAQNTLQITKLRSLSSANNLCKKIHNKSYIEPLSNELNDKNKELCINKFLNLLANKKTKLKSFKYYFSSLASEPSLLLTRNNIDDLAYFISRLSKTPTRKKIVSKKFTDYFLKNDTLPPKKILQHIHINHDLTKYIQITGLNKNSTRSIFHRELKKLIKKTFKLADNNKTEDQVINSLNQSLNYFKSTHEHLPLAKSSKVLLGLGKSLARRSYYKSAQSLYTTLIDTESPKIDEVYFELLWTHLTQEEYDNAFEHVIQKYSLTSKYKMLKNSKLSFWVGYTLLQKNDEQFKNIFENLIKDNPLSYYSIISSKYLQEHYKIPFQNVFLNIVNHDQYNHHNNSNLVLTNNAYKSLKRIKLWGKIDFKPLIQMELKNFSLQNSTLVNKKLSSFSNNNTTKSFNYLKAKALSKSDNYLESFKVVYKSVNDDAITINKDVLDILYPRPYWNKLKKSVKNFDPVIALSLIRQESAFNSKAMSHVGARGLMQIMPNTGRQFFRSLRKHQLYKPNLNIKIGTKYLSNLMNLYDHNLVYTLSAYNAGEGRVSKWRKEYLLSDSILHNIENIPFTETRKYVKLIFRNIFFYKLKSETDHKIELAESKKVNKLFGIHLGFNK